MDVLQFVMTILPSLIVIFVPRYTSIMNMQLQYHYDATENSLINIRNISDNPIFIDKIVLQSSKCRKYDITDKIEKNCKVDPWSVKSVEVSIDLI